MRFNGIIVLGFAYGAALVVLALAALMRGHTLPAIMLASFGLFYFTVACGECWPKVWWFCRMVVRALCGLPVLMLFAGCAAHPPALAARIAPPQPPQFSAVSAVAAPAQAFLLTWSNWPPSGVSNILQYGPVIDVWRITPLGETNQAVVTAPAERTYYRILPVLAGQPGVPSNVVKYPGDEIDTVIAQRLTDLSRLNAGAAWEDFSILARWTNTPPGNVLYRLRIEREEQSYEP